MRLLATLVVLVAACLLSGASLCDADAPAPNVIKLRAYRTKGVNQWSSFDAEEWMNFTVGYPEYSGIIKAHVIDGPALLAMTTDDLVDGFGLTHPLHLTKLRAHLSIVKGQCLCHSKAVDFWSYKANHPDNVFVLGSMMAFTPRLGMQYLYWTQYNLLEQLLAPKVLDEESLVDFPPLMDLDTSSSEAMKQKEKSKEFVSVDADEEAAAKKAGEAAATAAEGALSGLRQIPWFSTCFFLVSSILFPRIWVAFQLGFYFTSNPVVVALLWCPLLAGQIGDTMVFYSLFQILRGKVPSDGAPLSVGGLLKESINKIHLAIPILCYVLSFFLPYFLQDLLIFAFFAFACLVAVGVVQHTFSFIKGFFIGASGDGAGGAPPPPQS